MKKLIFLLSMMLAVVQLQGQGRDDFKVDSLKLTRQYQPTLAEAIKIQLKPELPQFDPERPKFQYKPIQNLSPGDFKLNPVGLSKSIIDPQVVHKSNRITVGFGTYNTPFLGLSLNTIQNKTWDLSLNVRHLNSSGSIDREGTTFRNVNYGETMASLDGHLYRKNWRYSGGITFDRQAVRYYGVDSTKLSGFTNTPSEAEAQHYNLFTIKAGVSNAAYDSLGQGFHAEVLSHILNDKKGQSEQQFQVKGNGRVVLSDQLIDWSARYFYSNYQGLLAGISRNMIHLSPRYVLKGSQWEAGMGLRIVYVGDSIENKLRLFPDFGFRWLSLNRKTQLDVALQGDVQANTFLSLMTQSPFSGTDLLLLNSPSIQIKVSGSHLLSPNSQLNAILCYSRTDNMMFFKNLGPYLLPDYDPQTTQFSAELRYQWQFSNSWAIETGVRYRHLMLDTMKTPWQTPRWTVDAKLKYNIDSKWQVKVEATGMEGIRALNLLEQEEHFPFLLDFSGRVVYAYNRKTSIFAQVLNLASMRYVRWYNYPSYGIQALVGLSIQL